MLLLTLNEQTITRMTRQILTSVFLLFSLFVFSQSDSTDIMTEAKKRGDDFYQKGVISFETNLDSAEYYARKAQEQYLIAKDWKNYVIAYCSVSALLYNQGEYEESYQTANGALVAADKYLPKVSSERNAVLSNLANFYYEIGQFKVAIEEYEKIYATEKLLKDTFNQSLTLRLIGWNYYHLGDVENALKHYQQSIELWKDVKGFIGRINIAKSYNRIGEAYFKIQELDNAILYLSKCLESLDHPYLPNFGCPWDRRT